MSTPAESFVTVGMRSQEAAMSAVRSWADGLQTFAGGESELSDMISRYFDVVQQVLDSQRQFAETMATAMQTLQTLTNQAAHAAEDTVTAMHAAGNGAATVTKAAKEQTSAIARTAKAATS
jgi:ABC-type transporter Mla subunit MlaD